MTMNDTVELLLEYFEYKDGGAYWKKKKGTQGIPGNRFGCVHKITGYRHGNFNRKGFLEHRIVWALHHNALPLMRLDHVNGDKTDNRIENLRQVTHSQNLMNAVGRGHNKSGHKGVSRHTEGKWQVSLGVNGKLLYFGLFEDFELACLVADEARDLYHGEYANYN